MKNNQQRLDCPDPGLHVQHYDLQLRDNLVSLFVTSSDATVLGSLFLVN